MAHSRPLSAQDRQFLLVLKAALRLPHEGPDAMPRKAVWMDLRVAESTYSRWLSDEELDWIPSLVDLRRIVNITGNVEPLRVFAKWSGGGFGIAPLEQVDPVETQEGHHLLAAQARASSKVLARIAEDLADGRIERREALITLPDTEANLRVAVRVRDTYSALAGTPQ